MKLMFHSSLQSVMKTVSGSFYWIWTFSTCHKSLVSAWHMSPRNDVNAKYKRAHPAISERVPSQKIKLKNLLFLHHFWPLIILVQPLIPPDLNQVFWSYLLKCYGPWCTDKSPNFLLFIPRCNDLPSQQECSFNEHFPLRSCRWFHKTTLRSLTLFVSALPVHSSSSAPWPSKCCCVSHTTRSGHLTNHSAVGCGALPHSNAEGGQYIGLSCHEPWRRSTHCL